MATVNSKGVVTGVKKGSTKITVISKKNKKKKASITVKVVAPASKVVLNMSNASVSMGSTLKLNASVKGACKGVVWSTSNKSIATVQKGVVSGKKKGSVTIKATAEDGSKKSATCKVNVGDASISIANLDFKNAYDWDETDCIIVTLDQAKVLNLANFDIKVKSFEKGSYNKKIKVSEIDTTNNKDYVLRLESFIKSGQYIQCTISTLSGRKTIEKQFKSRGYDREQLIYGVVGNDVDEEIYFSNMLGYYIPTVKSGVLPNGLSLSADTNYIKGTMNALANNTRVVLAATDELGTTSVSTLSFLIGNATTMYGENKTIGNTVRDRVYENSYFGAWIHVVGGSGDYTAEVIDNYEGIFEIEYDFGTEAYISADYGKLKLGTYTVNVRFTDANEATRTAIATLKLVVSKSNTVTSVCNSTTTYPEIIYRNLDTEDVFWTVGWLDDNKQTTYVPDGDYEVYIYTYGKKFVLNKRVTINNAATFTYNIPNLYKILGSITNNDVTYEEDYYIRIYDADKLNDGFLDYQWCNNGAYSFENVPAGRYIIKVYNYWNSELLYTSNIINVSNQDIINDVTLK